ncbi:MAG: pilus assembly protein PilP [Candidatus Berkiella sp.]
MRHKNKALSTVWGAILLCLLLAGCSNSERRAELESYVKRIKSRTIKEIEPLPEIKPYEIFTYSAANLHSPFVPNIVQEVAKKVVVENGIQPDMNRRKEALENFPLDSLRMVGTLEKNTKKWVLVVDPTGTVFRITKGNYIGQNHGHIDSISDERVMITEIIPDPMGGWRERKASISLADSLSKNKSQHPQQPPQEKK